MADEGVETLKKMNPFQIAFIITKYWRKPNSIANKYLHKMMDLKEDCAYTYKGFIDNSMEWSSILANRVRKELDDRCNRLIDKAVDTTVKKKIKLRMENVVV